MQRQQALNQDGPGRIWYAIDVLIEGTAHEAVEYGLMEAHALGTETNDLGTKVKVRGYFDRAPDLESIRQSLLDALNIYGLEATLLIDLCVEEVPNRDWLAEWKKSWRPVEVGRFIIAPPWMGSEPGVVATGPGNATGATGPIATAPGSDSIVIRINPGMAFGTGTHETTRLCLHAIEKHYRGGSFLDVGTGTGILAIAAAMYQHPDHQGELPLILAYDIDADAINIAHENAALNNVAGRINFRVGTVDDETESADFVCANLTAPVIVELLPALIGATCGRLILSGILDSQFDLLKSRLLELGVVGFEIDQDGEWIAITV